MFGLTDVEAWSGGYIGIGQVWDTDDQPTTAFFTSLDGVSWQVTQRLAPGEELLPWRLLATDDSLLAMIRTSGGAPELWSSTDGRTWRLRSSPTWRATWAAGSRLETIASGRAGLVAVGVGPTGALALFSADDGRSWQASTLAAGVGSEARSVVASGQGFVVVGVADGRLDAQLHQVLNGRSTAWTSPDGLGWQAATVEPVADDHLTFTGVYAAADGLLAIGSDTTGSVPGRPSQAWTSDDGRRWEPQGVMGRVVPRGTLAGDGVRMLILDPGDWSPFSQAPWPGYRSGWTSLDGRTWLPVSCTGQISDQQSYDGWWLTSQGLILSGSDEVWLAVAS